MTREEAADLLDNLIGMVEDNQENDYDEALKMAIEALNVPDTNVGDTISRQAAIDAILHNQEVYSNNFGNDPIDKYTIAIIDNDAQTIAQLPPAQPEIIRCKDCKHWRQQTNYQGVPLSFGFCESDDMWRSLYGETYEVSHIDTDDDFYCGYAERRTDE